LIILSSPATAMSGKAGDGTVIWTSAGRAYVVARDSLRLVPGARIAFDERRRSIAEGTVTAWLDDRLLAVRITSGTLEKVKRLDRLGVRLLSLPARGLLRVGIPSDQRANLVVPCGRAAFDAPPGDSLVAVPYDDAGDEEIALERGEIDVALFWPGELSARTRGDRRFAVRLGIRDRGWIAARWSAPAPDTGRVLERLDLAPIAEDLLDGDLVPLRPNGGVGTAVHHVACRADSTLPGWRVLEAAIAGGARRPEARIDLVWRDDAAPPAAAGAGDPAERALFRIGCTIVCPAALAPRVMELGPDALVSRLGCAGTRP